jgi:hypothetical protein
MIIKHGFLTLIVGLILLSTMMAVGGLVNQPYNPTNDVRHELQTKNYNIVKAIVDSPAIKVTVTSTTSLIDYAKNAHVNTIYDTPKGFVVIDVMTDVGYFYDTVPTSTWYGLAWPIGFAVFIIAGITLLFVIIHFEED